MTDDVEAALGNIEGLPAFLDGYRQRHGIGVHERPTVVFGLDATSLTQSGISTKTGQQGVMAFVMLPLNPLPDLVIQLQHTGTMKIDKAAKAMVDDLLAILATAGFETVAVASDGDSGTNVWHTYFYERYCHLPADAGPGDRCAGGAGAGARLPDGLGDARL
jgi:hypothetical protein